MKNILKILFGLLIALAGFFSIRLLDTPENLMRALPYLLIGAATGPASSAGPTRSGRTPRCKRSWTSRRRTSGMFNWRMPPRRRRSIS